jgi:hypothetical protein
MHAGSMNARHRSLIKHPVQGPLGCKAVYIRSTAYCYALFTLRSQNVSKQLEDCSSQNILRENRRAMIFFFNKNNFWGLHKLLFKDCTWFAFA